MSKKNTGNKYYTISDLVNCEIERGYCFEDVNLLLKTDTIDKFVDYFDGSTICLNETKKDVYGLLKNAMHKINEGNISLDEHTPAKQSEENLKPKLKYGDQVLVISLTDEGCLKHFTLRRVDVDLTHLEDEGKKTKTKK